MIRVNGKSYYGNNVTIIGNKVIIDGVDQTPDAKEISIQVEGNIHNLSVDYAKSIIISGDVVTLKSDSGDVSCRNVGIGGVNTGSGSVEVENSILGDVNTGSGSVKAGTIAGSVKTGSGNIKYIKHG